MKEVLAVFLIASLALSSNSALFPVGGRAVVIRIDDVQDYHESSPYAGPGKKLLQYHIEQNIPAMLAIIPTNFGEDPQLVDQVKNGVARNIFTVAIHGYRHISFINLSRSAQINEINYGKNKLETILGTNVWAFVPPFNEFNQDTIYAVKDNGLTLMSSSVHVGDMPRQEDGLAFLPETVFTATVAQNDSWALVPLESMIQQIKDSWSLYGVAVITFHPIQLIGPNNEDRWTSYIDIIEEIVANQGNIIRFEPKIPLTKNNIDPFLISVGVFSGLTSTLLIAINVSTRRRKRHSSYHADPNPALKHSEDAANAKAAIPKADSESEVKAVAFDSKSQPTDRSIIHAVPGNDSALSRSYGLKPANILQDQSSGASFLTVVSCGRCGRRIAEDDRFCDECGLPASQQGGTHHP